MNEAGAWRQQPQNDTDQIIWTAKSPHRRMGYYGASSF